MSRLLPVAVMLFLFSCGGSQRKLTVEGPTSTNQEADLGLEELRKSLESTVLEMES